MDGCFPEEAWPQRLSLDLHSDFEGVLARREDLLGRQHCGEPIELDVDLAVVVVHEKVAVGPRACSGRAAVDVSDRDGDTRSWNGGEVFLQRGAAERMGFCEFRLKNKERVARFATMPREGAPPPLPSLPTRLDSIRFEPNTKNASLYSAPDRQLNRPSLTASSTLSLLCFQTTASLPR